MMSLVLGGTCNNSEGVTACPSGQVRQLSPLMHARWRVAVTTELAEEGALALSPVYAANALADFKVTAVSSGAARLLGRFQDALIGQCVESVLGAGSTRQRLLVVCADAWASSVDAFQVPGVPSARHGSQVLMDIQRASTVLHITLSCPEAKRNMVEACEALRELLMTQSFRAESELFGPRNRVPILLLPNAVAKGDFTMSTV